MKRLGPTILAAALALAAPALAQTTGAKASPKAHYSVVTHGDVVQLRDNRAGMIVSVLTPVSNAYEIVVKGHDVIRMGIRSVDDMRARPGLNGIPFLAPFANRLDEPAFYANGKKYNFDMELGNVRGNIPIHGFLSNANAWKVVEAKSDGNAAWVTTKLDFYRIPDYMKQFPFAHALTMTYRVSNGELEVRTRIDNLSDAPMPVSIGFHPYFSLTDSVRADWTLDAPVKTHWLLDANKVPNGQTEPAETVLGDNRHAVPMSRFATHDLDDVFSDLERDAQGRATVTVTGAKQKLAVTLGPKFRTLLIYSTVPNPPRPANAPAPAANTPPANAAPRPAPPPPVSVGPAIPLSATDTAPIPPERGFIAFEPMVGISDAMNLAQKGLYKELQSIQPRGSWQESFWVKPTGY